MTNAEKEIVLKKARYFLKNTLMLKMEIDGEYELEDMYPFYYFNQMKGGKIEEFKNLITDFKPELEAYVFKQHISSLLENLNWVNEEELNQLRNKINVHLKNFDIEYEQIAEPRFFTLESPDDFNLYTVLNSPSYVLKKEHLIVRNDFREYWQLLFGVEVKKYLSQIKSSSFENNVQYGSKEGIEKDFKTYFGKFKTENHPRNGKKYLSDDDYKLLNNYVINSFKTQFCKAENLCLLQSENISKQDIVWAFKNMYKKKYGGGQYHPDLFKLMSGLIPSLNNLSPQKINAVKQKK